MNQKVEIIKLKVNLENLDIITEKTLKFFFNSNLCSFAEFHSSKTDADIIVVDFDRGLNDDLSNELLNNNQYALVLHSKTIDTDKNERFIWLEKPFQAIKMNAILESSYKLIKNIDKDITIIKESQKPTVFKNIIDNKNNSNSHIYLAVSDKPDSQVQSRFRAHKHVGSNMDIDPNNPGDLSRIFLTPNKYLYYHLANAIKLANVKCSDIRVKTLFGSILYEYKSKIFFHNLENTKLKYMQSNPLFKDTKLSFTKIKSQTKETRSSITNSIGFLWESAILASKGRIPKNTKIHNIVNMLDWPNFSKLIVFRHAVQICAVWSRNSLSIIDSATQLKIPQRYVLTLFCAMQAINCASIDNTTSSNKIEETTSKTLFSKILSHIFSK